MTLKQLMNSVAALGFESDIDDTGRLYEAAGRALDLLYTDKVITKTVVISRLLPTPSKIIPAYRHAGDDKSTSYKLIGKAYSFATVGEGSFAVFDGNKTYTESFKGAREHRGIIESGEAIITFFGEYIFDVSEIVVFGSLVSADAEDVPLYSELYVINMKDTYDDYLSLAGEVCTTGGRRLSVVEEGGFIYINDSYTGAVMLTYRCKAPDIFNTDMDAELNVPRECEALLPFVTASIIWLDDDADKAQYYMAIYRDMLSSLLLERQGIQSASYVTNGWA